MATRHYTLSHALPLLPGIKQVNVFVQIFHILQPSADFETYGGEDCLDYTRS